MMTPTPPPLSLTLSEIPRATRESLQTALGLNRLIRQHRGANGDPVLVLPGYGAADGSTTVLRYFLRRIGYRPYALDLGRNVENSEDRIKSVDDASRFRQKMVALVVPRIRRIHEDSGSKVSLVGWSMGGLYALDASREVPELTRQVITLGSPFGDPRGTSLFKLMRKLSRSTVPLDSQDFDGWLQRASAPVVPTRVIYSQRDGIVGTSVARLPPSRHTEHELVDSSHVAFAVNCAALDAVAKSLRGSSAEGVI